MDCPKHLGLCYISILSYYLGREVDIILLKNCHFAHRIREEGILWTTNN